jgi:hypothetical protein
MRYFLDSQGFAKIFDNLEGWNANTANVQISRIQDYSPHSLIRAIRVENSPTV